jgi:hypothetical protein
VTLLAREADFWAYLREREAIRLRRAQGLPREEWTTDPIMKTYRFTNVKREHDRTTMLLQREFYTGRSLTHPSPVALLNATSARYFGTIESMRANGWMGDWGVARRDVMAELTDRRLLLGEKVYTSAYVVPAGGRTGPKVNVVCDVLDGIWLEAEMILKTDSWRDACFRMCMLDCVGSFMAKEVLLDYVLATGWVPMDWQTWTPVGPGGRLGAGVVRYGMLERIAEPEALDVIRAVYDHRATEWSGVELDLTDIQFAFCEFAKYEKARLGGRPKRYFSPTIDDVTVYQ